LLLVQTLFSSESKGFASNREKYQASSSLRQQFRDDFSSAGMNEPTAGTNDDCGSQDILRKKEFFANLGVFCGFARNLLFLQTRAKTRRRKANAKGYL
jgi:hypothetical protein